jgi:hypothetical protein
MNGEGENVDSNAREVPGADKWGAESDDLDLEYARRIFFAKTAQQMFPLFDRNVIERADEIRFMPDACFPYYVLAFKDYVLLDSTKEGEMAPDAASSFIRLIAEKLGDRRALVQPLMVELFPALEHLVLHQADYGADVDIYGDFGDRVAEIKRLWQG